MKLSLEKKLIKLWRAWGYSIVITVLVATSFKSAIADWNDIPTGSMKPTILIGDRVYVNKLAYDFKVPYTTLHLAKWSDPQRGDIVVFFSPEDGTRLIKRVVGLPGDVIGMHQKRLLVNGEFIRYEPPQQEIIDRAEQDQQSDYIYLNEDLEGKQHSVMFSLSRPSPDSFGPVVIPEGKFFMMGDNRDNSADSRFFGLVDRNLIVGRATMVVVSRKGSFFHPRWDRFFKDLS